MLPKSGRHLNSQPLRRVEVSQLLAVKEAERLVVLRWAAHLCHVVRRRDILQEIAVRTAEIFHRLNYQGRPHWPPLLFLFKRNLDHLLGFGSLLANDDPCITDDHIPVS